MLPACNFVTNLREQEQKQERESKYERKRVNLFPSVNDLICLFGGITVPLLYCPTEARLFCNMERKQSSTSGAMWMLHRFRSALKLH